MDEFRSIHFRLDAIERALSALLEQGNALMSGLTDLQSAVAALQAFQTVIVAELGNLATAVTVATTGDSDATIETLAQDVNASIAAMQAAATSAAAVLSTPTPTPAAPAAVLHT